MRWLGAGALVLLLLIGTGLWVFWPTPPSARMRALTPVTEPAETEAGGPLRIAVLGTSLTAYYDWPQKAAAALEACLGRPVELTVLARGGASSAWGVTQAAALTEAAAEIVLLEFTVNDADLRRQVSPAAALAHHETLLAAARAGHPDPRIVLMTLNRAHGLRALLRPRIGVYEAQYDALAETADLGRLSLGPAYAAAGDRAGQIPDGVHPTPEAVATHVTPAVSAELRRLAGLAETAC